MYKPLLILTASLALSLPALSQAGAKEDFNEVYSKVESTHNQAGTYQWTTTANQLKAAKEAADSGDYEKALEMAEQALKYAEQSLEQRKQQQEKWPAVAIGN
ncbi:MULTISPECIES: hypothetical protein [Marinobacter]|uniref:SoxXA-binding protein n=1 Tax=Marinobacter suaedae TaxID=3057675 RepID=A0ABT8W1U0_9GAMM|nr:MULTISPECIES: hypothetical protein [unclassified Marinobacter]MBZ2168069.1 hypothetical protein [Marinobacter sp. F4216]MDO3722185.1 hypothetical protein [Marinobacter sp. chi1]